MSTRLPTYFLLLMGSWMIVLIPQDVFAQETPQQIRVRAETAKDPLLPVNLRPNTPTAFRLLVQNPNDFGLGEVTVKLVQIVEKEERVIASAGLETLPAKDEARLIFAKAKDDKDKRELVGPPFKVQIWIEAKQPKNFVTVKRDLDLVIREPRDYVTSIAEFDKTKGRLSFKVKLDESENLIGPHPCHVELILGPEFAENKKGTFKQQLTAPKQPVDLLADDVAFTENKIREGRVYLMVDGYQRAFTYPVTLAGSGYPDQVRFGKQIGARIEVPRYSKPNKNFAVKLELDGPLDAGYRVEVGLDRTAMKEQFQVVNRTGLRQQKISLSFSAAGDLVWQTEVKDWQVEFDTTGVFGDIWLRVRVFKKNSKTGKEEKVTLTHPKESRFHLATLETDDNDKALFARVVQDESPAAEIEFVDLPEQIFVGRPLPVTVKIRKRDAQQAPVAKVLFFRGKQPAKGDFDPELLLGVGKLDPKTGEWSFQLPAQEKAEPLVLSVQATTQTGVLAVKTATIAIKATSGKGIAKIKGTVARGELPQLKLTVTLSDAKGNLIGTEKTNDKGEFVFENVPPGNYVVRSTMSSPALIGQTKVVVPEGEILVDKVSVRLLAK